MTGTEFVTAVKDHIGDRQTGRIGSQSVDDACLASVNKAIRHIAKIPNFNPEELQEKLTLSLTSSNYSYTMPTSTSGTIKSIFSTTMMQISETTGRTLQEIPKRLFDSYWPIMDSSRTGRPNSYAIVDKSTANFYPWPDDSYYVYFWVNLFPNEIAVGTESPYDEIWDEAIEAYATFDVFSKLQQTQDAASWYSIFRVVKGETLGAIRKYPARMLDINTKVDRGSYGMEPGLDPFVRCVR